MSSTELTFSIGEVAAMLGISPHTIRAWERRHMMVKPARTASGQRRYTSDDVEVLRQVKHGRHVRGFSMRVATMAAQGLVVPDQESVPPGAQAAEGAEEDPLRMAANLVPQAVVVLHEDGRIAEVNTAFVRFCDLMPGQLRGTPFADLVDPFDRAKAVETYREPLRQRRAWELNLRSARRVALYSFDCWPVKTGQGWRLVLIGHEVGNGRQVEDTAAGASSQTRGTLPLSEQTAEGPEAGMSGRS
ncbi:MAG: MerR family transcriptional regulator [Candidatus Dormibacteraeota bacterium]|nr:MerR family transcriptional regulator [Candidatus Dormibacteraeota bacterium]